jgi:hypothetical protein
MGLAVVIERLFAAGKNKRTCLLVSEAACPKGYRSDSESRVVYEVSQGAASIATGLCGFYWDEVLGIHRGRSLRVTLTL